MDTKHIRVTDCSVEKPMNEFPLMEVGSSNTVLFHPHIPAKAIEYISNVYAPDGLAKARRLKNLRNSSAPSLAVMAQRSQ